VWSWSQAAVSCRPLVPIASATAPSRATSHSRNPVNGRSPAWAPNSRRSMPVPAPGFSSSSPCRPRLGPPPDGPPPPASESSSPPGGEPCGGESGPGSGRRSAVRVGRRVVAGRGVATGPGAVAAAARRQDRDRRVAGHGRVGREGGREAGRVDLQAAGPWSAAVSTGVVPVRSPAARLEAVRTAVPAVFEPFPAAFAAPLERVSAAVAAPVDAVMLRAADSAAAARALRTRAADRPGDAGDRTGTVVTTGVAACWTAVTGAGTPATGPPACAGPADQAAIAQAATASVKMLPRQEQARLALINICG
jgi:hypothetical protein